VYVCIYVCLYVCVYVNMLCVYVYMFCVYVYMFCVYVCIHVCVYVCTFACIAGVYLLVPAGLDLDLDPTNNACLDIYIYYPATFTVSFSSSCSFFNSLGATSRCEEASSKACVAACTLSCRVV
jgi:hypothetical protein